MAATEGTVSIVQPQVATRPRPRGVAVPVRRPVAVERLAQPLARVGLLVVMVFGCVALVTAIPAAWLWLGSQLTDSYIFPPGYVYLLIGVGIPVSMAVGGKLLCCAGAVHERLRGTPQRSVPDAWRRSRSDATGPNAPVTALDVISTAVGVTAVIALLVYIGVDLLNPVIQ